MSEDTKPMILNTAERLFADRGVESTSLRTITAEAGVNLASVNYHFGSKEGLVHALFRRRFEPLNQRRTELFDQIEAQNPSGPPPVGDVLRALIEPTIQMMLDHPEFMRLCGWLMSSSSDKRNSFIDERFGAIRTRVIALLRRALPDLPEEEIHWRIHFIVGAMVHTWTRFQDLVRDGYKHPQQDVTKLVVHRLVLAGEAILTATSLHPSSAGNNQ